MSFETLLLLPPVLFVVVLGLVVLEYVSFGALSLKQPPGKAQPPGKLKPYACGEDVADHKAQPDYSQFFPFAFFFTIMHVVALVVATIPSGVPLASAVAVAFLVSAAVGLFILFRR
ncbi:MAG: hypothetical protein HY901_04720 [Deltaproteobacteria bacterium]|nr:hypothetical protein [Deltaproteobacteria bacterium]